MTSKINLDAYTSRLNLKMLFSILSEPRRVIAELGEFQQSLDQVLADAPEGDGHPVMVIPGFSAPEGSTALFRHALEKKGYAVYSWGAGANTGITYAKLEQFLNNVVDIYIKHGSQKISFIGHSLGGFDAQLLAQISEDAQHVADVVNTPRLDDLLLHIAKRVDVAQGGAKGDKVTAADFPNMVRDIITFGSPINVAAHKNEVPKLLVNIIQLLSSIQLTDAMSALLIKPLKHIPATYIQSKKDNIGGVEASQVEETELAQNVVLEDSTHAGLAICSKAGLVVALDRLAQREDISLRTKYDAQKYAATRTKPQEKAKATSRNSSGHRRPAVQPN